MLRSLLTAGLAALPIPQAPAAVGTGFHAYELGDNSRGRKDGDRFSSRAEALGESKRTIAKIFGLGKSSKSKPGPLLEKARDLYDNINKELNETDE